MKKFISKILICILIIYLSDKILKNVELALIPHKSAIFGIPLSNYWQILVIVGSALFSIDFFIKSILEKIFLPLNLLTFGLVGLILNMLTLWAVDLLFPEFNIVGIFPLFLTTLFYSAVNFVLKIILL